MIFEKEIQELTRYATFSEEKAVMKSWTRSCILKNLVDIDFQHRKQWVIG